MAEMVVIRPSYDEATAATAPWASDVLSLAPGSPDLAGADATRFRVQAVLPGARAVVFYGHGSAIGLLGEQGALISLPDVVAGRLAGKVMFAIACYSGGLLGWLATARGADLYIGYRHPFYFWPEVDAIFRQLANTPVLRMMGGSTAEEAIQITRATYERAIDLFLTGRGRGVPDAPAIAADLRSNADCLVRRGNPDLKI